MAKKAKGKVPVSERALVQRINRKLARSGYYNRPPAHYGYKLCRARLYPGGYEDTNLGRYYIIDVGRNELGHSHIDLEDLGRDIGALADYEELAD